MKTESTRRTNAVMGYVNFPVESKKYISSKEGGMYVWLVVPYSRTDVCCCTDGGISLGIPNAFLGTDTQPSSDNFDDVYRCVMKKLPIPEQKFPLEDEIFGKSFIAAIMLGSTGWSGIDKNNNYWRCKYEDLTSYGAEVYDLFKNIYSRPPILLTCLDT